MIAISRLKIDNDELLEEVHDTNYRLHVGLGSLLQQQVSDQLAIDDGFKLLGPIRVAASVRDDPI